MTMNSIKMVSKDQSGTESTQLVDINQGTSQIVSKGLEMMNSELSTFVYSSDALFYLRHNLLNGYYLAV